MRLVVTNPLVKGEGGGGGGVGFNLPENVMYKTQLLPLSEPASMAQWLVIG